MRQFLSRAEIGWLRRTIRLAWDSGPYWTILSVILLLLQIGMSLGALYLLKLGVDAVALSVGAADPWQAIRNVAILIFAALLLAVLGNLVSVLSDLVGRAQSQTIADHVQSVVLGKAARVDLSRYESHQYYDILHRVQFDASWRP